MFTSLTHSSCSNKLHTKHSYTLSFLLQRATGLGRGLALGTWVSNQREYKRKVDRGEAREGMAAARVAKLEELGFAWCALDIAYDAAPTMA